jgi:hypothetical protein
MRTTLALLAASAALAAAAPAGATLYSTSLTGSVASQTGTSYLPGTAVTGSFTYDSDTDQFLTFRIGSYSAAQPFVSQVTTVPSGVVNPFSATYSASSSAAQTGGTTNTSFALDLESLTAFGTNNALTVLTTPNLLGLLDTDPADFPVNSTFSYYTGSASGTGITQVVANLTGISVSTSSVPEPASLALLSTPLLLGLALRRRA